MKVREIEISYSHPVPYAERQKITSSTEAIKVLKWAFADCMELKEKFVILLLDRANTVKGIHELSVGGVAGCTVDLKILFAIACKTLASGVILCHNHPSGNLKPSPEDLRITKKIVEAGKLLDISVLDHIIITEAGSVSLSEEGLM